MRHLWILMMLFGSAGLTACEDRPRTDAYSTNQPDTAVLVSDAKLTPAEKEETNWEQLDWDAPVVRYPEVSGAEVRSSGSYSLYSLGDNVLFASGSSVIRTEAENNLREIAASINQRYNGGSVRVYGYADSVGDSRDNQVLSRQRAEAVKEFLMRSGSIATNRIQVIARGEQEPIRSNSTESGKQQNRRVVIVARKS